MKGWTCGQMWNQRCLAQYIIYGLRTTQMPFGGKFSPHVTTVWASLGFWWQICFGHLWTEYRAEASRTRQGANLCQSCVQQWMMLCIQQNVRHGPSESLDNHQYIQEGSRRQQVAKNCRFCLIAFTFAYFWLTARNKNRFNAKPSVQLLEKTVVHAG